MTTNIATKPALAAPNMPKPTDRVQRRPTGAVNSANEASGEVAPGHYSGTK